MKTALREMSKSSERFEWYEHILQLGSKAFLHGDVLDAGLTKDRLLKYRKKFSGELIAKGKIANMLYDALIASRAHRLPGQWHHTPKKTTIKHLIFQPKFFEFTEKEVALRHELALDCLALPVGSHNSNH